MPEKSTEMAPRQEHRLAAREYFEPFRMMERMADEMDRVFGDVFGRGWLTPRVGRSWLRSPLSRDLEGWVPDIEAFHRNHEFVVRADLPGLTKNDIKVDITDDRIIVQGERKHEHVEEQRGVYRSERGYGSFYREIPLPEGTMTDQAKASFKDGVLEITMPAPPEAVRRGRRLEITETTASKK